MSIGVPLETAAGKTGVAVAPENAKKPLLIGVPKETAPGEKRVATVPEVVEKLGGIDVLVNNAGEQHPDEEITDISEKQLKRTFQTNIFSMFFLTQAVRPHLQAGAAIVNCTSVTMYEGSKGLLDYSATKGAITAFTRSLSENLVGDGIRVNGVAPGPIWTPLIPSTMPPDTVAKFGSNVPMKRPGQPAELATAYVMLADPLSSYVSGATIPVTGGRPFL